MATDYKAINSYPQGTPTASSRVPYFDSGGTIRYTQLADLQEALPPPNLWQRIALDNVKIVTADSNHVIKYEPAHTALSHAADYLGFALMDSGMIVFPASDKIPWGDKTAAFSGKTLNTLFNESYGKNVCNAAYNASAANRGTNCAIGFAHNFSRKVNGYGIAAGKWSIPTTYECATRIQPHWYKISYLYNLMTGNFLEDYIWTADDVAPNGAARYSFSQVNAISASKDGTGYSLLLICDLQYYATTS